MPWTLGLLAFSLAAAPIRVQAGWKDFFGGGKKGGGGANAKDGGSDRKEREVPAIVKEARQEYREAKKEVREDKIELKFEKAKAKMTGDKGGVQDAKKDLEQSKQGLDQAAQKLQQTLQQAASLFGWDPHHKPKPEPKPEPKPQPSSGAGEQGSEQDDDDHQGGQNGDGSSEASVGVPVVPGSLFPQDPDGEPKKPEHPLAAPPELGLGIGTMLEQPHPDQQPDLLPVDTKDLTKKDDLTGRPPAVLPEITPQAHPTPAVKEKFDKRKLARRVGQQTIGDLGSVAPPDQEGEEEKDSAGDPLDNTVVLPDGTTREKDDTQVLEARAALSAAEAKAQIGDLDGAISDAERSFKAVPNTRALNAKANVLIKKASKKGVKKEEKQELYLKAIETAEQALRMDAKNAAAYEIVAWAKLRLGNYIGTIEAASHAIRLRPKGADAYAVRAFAHEQLGHKEEMLQDIEKAAERAPAKYAKLARAAKRGERLFDPDAEEGMLSDSIAAVSGRRVGPMAVLGTLAALLGVLAGVILLLRTKIAALLMPEGERLRSELAAQLASSPAPKAEDNGLLAGKYQLSRVIGKGGMGQVWEAQDHSLGRVVAVKKMTFGSSEQEALARELYIKEARTLASLHHPNIVDIYEIMDQSSGLYLVFELLSGKKVQHLLAERKRLSLAQARDILKPVCEALDFAHGRGIVHRDLKPSNIMVTDQGYVKVMDFGIARRMEEPVAASVPANGAGVFDAPQSVISGPFSMARTRTIAGTPAYMAPEAESGLVSPKTDVYALGVCLYEMMTGELPFGHDGGLQQRLDRSYVKASARVPGLPGAIDELISTALDPIVETRLSSTRAFFLCLQSVREVASAAR
ncbi:MAG: protein kinase [Elusimicrobiota bacterium]